MTNRNTAQPETSVIFDTRGLADYFNNSESFWEKRRLAGDGPLYHKLGRKVFYRLADVEEWMAKRAHHSTSEYTDPEQTTAA
jgi:hypothetical protein